MSCSIGYAKKPCYENIKMESLFNECGLVRNWEFKCLYILIKAKIEYLHNLQY